MSRETISLTEPVQHYLSAQTVREHDALARLRTRTAELPDAQMQICPEQGQFMALLVEMLGARRAIEVGTFTGYSALWVALALPEDGRLIACEKSPKWNALARENWAAAGVGHKIDLRLGPASQTLDALIAAGESGSYDFAFIDADKTGYDGYYERSLHLLRPGGIVALDNALRAGRVADPSATDPDTLAVRALNEKVRDDDRVTTSLVPIGDGLLLARKR